MLSNHCRAARLALLAALILFPVAGGMFADQQRHVTVLAVLASSRNTQVDPKVKSIAEEVQKLEPGLTGFRLARTTSKSVVQGKPEQFPLVADQVLVVHFQQVEDKDKDERVQLTVKAPLAGEITYTSCCGKFFPIMTRYLTKDNERLIVAIMVKSAKKHDK